MTVKSLLSFLNKGEEQFSEEAIAGVLNELKQKYNFPESGVQLVDAGDGVQFVSNPENAELVKRFVKDDFSGELTPASLETLTVIAFRGPITKPELEQIRGVNCSLILRNLLIRGLIIGDENKQNMQTYYQVTTDFLKHLGINSVEELPDYQKLHVVENLEEFLNKAEQAEQVRQVRQENFDVVETVPGEEKTIEEIIVEPIKEKMRKTEVVEEKPIEDEVKKNRDSSDEEIY
jgi:segregation and condensation protein B